mmetsp:Transcript_21866/g.47736  ORF Transcript_21866/g.47736 Transcript_21866/m.47736 type:complete len:85 (-) Transcript_21866:566-820(-)
MCVCRQGRTQSQCSGACVAVVLGMRKCCMINAVCLNVCATTPDANVVSVLHDEVAAHAAAASCSCPEVVCQRHAMQSAARHAAA